MPPKGYHPKLFAPTINTHKGITQSVRQIAPDYSDEAPLSGYDFTEGESVNKKVNKAK